MKPKEVRVIVPKYMTEHYKVGIPCKFKGNVVGRVIHVDYEKCIITVELCNVEVVMEGEE